MGFLKNFNLYSFLLCLNLIVKPPKGAFIILLNKEISSFRHLYQKGTIYWSTLRHLNPQLFSQSSWLQRVLEIIGFVLITKKMQINLGSKSKKKSKIADEGLNFDFGLMSPTHFP